MSNLILAPVWKMKLKPSPKFVAVSLADQANDDGYCWPGVASISKRTGISHRTVQEALRYLESIRLIKVVERPGKSNGYQFNMEMIRQSELFDGVDTDDDEGQGVRNSQGCEIRRGATAAPRGAKFAGEGCESRTQTINNHQEPSGGGRAPARGAALIPEDWTPRPETAKRCRDAGYPDITPGEIAGFIGHHRANRHRFEPSAIEDAFVSWMHKAQRYNGNSGGAPNGRTGSAPPKMPDFDSHPLRALVATARDRYGIDIDYYTKLEDIDHAALLEKVKAAWRRENGVRS